MNVSDLQNAAAAFARERDWEQFHDAKNLAMALASEVGELNAVLRWVRNADVDAALREQRIQHALRTEIGDVGILLLLLCARAGVTLEDAVLQKLALNAQKYPVDSSRGRPDPPA